MKMLVPDRTLIASTENLVLQQGEMTKHGSPVLTPEYPWEEIHTYLYGSVIRTKKLYRMWYQSYVDNLGFFVNYARSSDGITWEKPLVRRRPHGGAMVYPSKNNIVSTYHIPSVISDAEDQSAPYKLFGHTDAGYCVAFSKDGLRFQDYAKNPVIPAMRFPNPQTKKTWLSDVAPVFKDTKRKRFVSLVKTYVVDDQGRTRRCVGYSESRDFLTWTAPETMWSPSEADDRLAAQRGFQWADFYGLCGFNYGDVYLGFLWLFFIDYEFEKGTHEGKIEVYLAHSADGKRWERFSSEPFIPLTESGWETGMITTANVPVFEKDRTLIYYGGSNISHGVGHADLTFDHANHRFSTGLAFVEKDRFACLASAKGSLMTTPLKSERGTIKVNADARNGKILVHVLADGAEPEPFQIAGVDSTGVVLNTKARGKVVLRVDIEGARLYALEVL